MTDIWNHQYPHPIIKRAGDSPYASIANPLNFLVSSFGTSTSQIISLIISLITSYKICNAIHKPESLDTKFDKVLPSAQPIVQHSKNCCTNCNWYCNINFLKDNNHYYLIIITSISLRRVLLPYIYTRIHIPRKLFYNKL